MFKYQVFTFNPIQVNTYVLYDQTGECAVIDNGAYFDSEKAELYDFIDSNSLKPVLLLNTHGHIDHILGNEDFTKRYNLELAARSDGMQYYDRADAYASAFGMRLDQTIRPTIDLKGLDEVKFGNTTLKVLFTPGHAEGSVCFYSELAQMVFTGDTLFRFSYGRTDLPGGSYDKIANSIMNRLFALPDETMVMPGHGPQSTIGEEKMYNPIC